MNICTQTYICLYVLSIYISLYLSKYEYACKTFSWIRLSMSRANGLCPNGLNQRRICGQAGTEGPRLVAGQIKKPDVLLHELCEELRPGTFGWTEAFQWRCMKSIGGKSLKKAYVHWAISTIFKGNGNCLENSFNYPIFLAFGGLSLEAF